VRIGSANDRLRAIAEWREDFNTARPHSSLGFQAPTAFAEVFTATGSGAE
jgi:transposase InsO family protein